MPSPRFSSTNQPRGIRRGEQHHSAKLTEVQVRKMRAMHNNLGVCVKCLGLLYNVPYVTAWDAISGRTWKHVK